jgi:small-conductance mechanosensitive channel
MFNFFALDQEIIENGLRYGILIRIGIAVAIFIVQILVIKLIWKLFRVFSEKIDIFVKNKIKPVKIKNIQLLNKKHLRIFFEFLLKLLKWIITIALLVFTIPIILSLFEPTRDLASKLFGYILAPLRKFALALLNYIPNMVSIAIIIILSHYIMRLLKFFSRQISSGHLKIQGFYPDWADTTYNVLRILIFAFTVAMVFPLLPGSDSQVFQGVSILVGVIFSLGSSSVVGNLVAGIVITYMRPFKLGDRIKINDIVGFVVEKTPMTTRIRTHKNEFVSLPNQMMMNASITNYNTSIERGQPGLILHANVTFGYDTPWQTVESLLLKAAGKTSRLEAEPPPFVQQTALGDFYCVYELNVCTKDIQAMIETYSELYRNIQIAFDNAGLSLTAPHFYNISGGRAHPKQEEKKDIR